MTAMTLDLDRSGAYPALKVRLSDGRPVWLNGRYDPIDDAGRWLSSALRDAEPAAIVLIGLGLGYALDALERRGSAASVIAFEPFADAVPHFRARRDWSAWTRTGRLHIVTGPAFAGGGEAWRALQPSDSTPVLVSPPLASEMSPVAASCRMAWMQAKRGTPADPFSAAVKQSMLHPVVLTALEHFAGHAQGLVVEIGAYVGGATMAMARGIRDSGRATPLVTIEPGGAHLEHPELPSADIFGDLLKNLRARDLERFVTLHRGFSSDPAALALVARTRAAHGVDIGMLCIDADGEVQRDLDLYLPACGDGCLLSIDDYVSPMGNTKTDATQAAVHALVAAGRAEPLGVFGWGTWMGVYHP